MKKNTDNLFLFLIIGLALAMFMGCSPKSDYDKMVERELASGERNDSIFLGMYLGMSNEDFFKHCWELNKQKKIKQGPENESAQFEIQGEDDIIYLNFYPTFHEGKIYEMPITLNYKSWSPWNKQYSADSLQEEILPIFEKWYGPGFLKVQHPRRGVLYVKVEGNRRVMFYIYDEWKVKGSVTDLPVFNSLKTKNSDGSISGT